MCEIQKCPMYALRYGSMLLRSAPCFIHLYIRYVANVCRKKSKHLDFIRYPNLNKIQTFQKKDVNRNKYRLKRFGFYFWCMIPL